MSFAATLAAFTIAGAGFLLKNRKSGPATVSGLWLYLWPEHGWQSLEPHVIESKLRAYKVAGVIVHNGLHGYEWLSPARMSAFSRMGIKMAAGFGMDTPSYTAETIANAIIAGYDRCGAIVLDWESSNVWESANGRAKARDIVSRCLSARQQMFGAAIDVPWWAPLTLPSGGGTHPNAPTVDFGRLVTSRFVQAYGKPIDGRSLAMLAHARRQYATLGNWRIMGTFQAYGRSFEDQLATLRAEPTQILWNLSEMDANCDRALRAHATERV